MAELRGWLAAACGVAYAGLYAWAIGDLDLGGQGWSWQPVSLTLERALAMRAPFHFEAVALAELGPLVVLVSPGNAAVGAVLGLALALNVDGALDLRRQAACATPTSHGALSAGALPALLAGGACCAPSLLLLLGMPGLGAFVALFPWLIPLSLLILMGSRVWQRRKGARAVWHWL
jgi:hypothetical protein